MGLLVLVSCDAHAPKSEASSPGASAAAAAVPGASDPAECKDEVPPPDPGRKPVMSDDMLAELTPCTKKLAKGGRIDVSLIVSAAGAIEKVNVGGSTVKDCRVVSCVKARFSKLRFPTPETPYRFDFGVSLELLPGKPPRRLGKDEPPLASSEAESCVDPKDPEFARGRLQPEVIQKAVRGRYDAFRRCYEAGLAVNPQLTGLVRTRFIIGRDGRVSASYVEDTTLPDCRVSRCVRDEMARIVFPEPNLGIVTVVYPIMLAPGEPPQQSAGSAGAATTAK
jgi:hypothetical protein